MKTARPPAHPEGEPLVLLESAIGQRRRGAWAASLLLHAAAVLILALMPPGDARLSRPRELRSATILVAPPRELTQTAPNRNPIGKEFTLESLLPRRPLHVPAAIPPMTSSASGRAPVPAPKPRQVIEAPNVETAGALPAQGPAAGSILSPMPAPPPPPQIQAEEKPKLAFETPGRPGRAPAPGGLAPGTIAMPGGTVTEAVRAAVRQGAGGVVVGDFDLPGSGGIGGGISLPGSTARAATSLELLSDPRGIDFKPYLIQLLAGVRRNWRAVIPESARLGRQGRVQIQFALARDGKVRKLVIALPSGTQAFDRAAVTAISMTSDQGFPPFPSGYTSDEMRLQLTFLYNISQ